MKIVELQCPSCGAKLSIDEKNPNMAVCEYCNSRYAIEWNKDQAYFNQGINYQIPKEPVPEEKKTGWEYYGWKRGALITVIGIVAILGLRAPGIYNRWKMNQNPAAEAGTQIKVEIPQQNIGQSTARQEEETEETVLTGCLGELAALVFDCSMDEVTAEDIGKIKWLEMKYSGGIDENVKLIGYSFDDPMAEGAVLNWIPFPWEADLGRECLPLFKGLKKINMSTNFTEKNFKGLKLESIGGYFDSPGEAASVVEDASLVKELRFNSGVESLDGLEEFSGLQSLYIDGSELSDVSRLLNLPELKKLELEGFANLSDFSVFGKISGLEELSVGSENLKVLDFLKGMDSLKSLAITAGNMISLDGIEQAEGLVRLEVTDCMELKNMDKVSALTGLEELSLELPYDCSEPDISGLTRLKKLKLSQFGDCGFLTGLSGLEELDLDSCSLSGNLDLSGMTGLKVLRIHAFAGMGKELGFVAGIPSLEKLDMAGMSTYDDISSVFNMGNLKELTISGMECEINFDKIGDNQTLEHLEMDGMVLYNNIQLSGGGGIMYADWDDVTLDEHTDFLRHFKALKSLSIADNELTDISFAAGLDKLETLDLSENYVTELRPLAELKALKNVICTGNPISNDRVLGDRVNLIKD